MVLAVLLSLHEDRANGVSGRVYFEFELLVHLRLSQDWLFRDAAFEGVEGVLFVVAPDPGGILLREVV
jgi:hypothetical protein